MECDRVFRALTAAPFPTGSPDDQPVSAHLEHCDSCRAIAEALRPARANSPESLPVAVRRRLPAFNARRHAPSLVAIPNLGSPAKRGENPLLAAAPANSSVGLPLAGQVAAFTLAARQPTGRLSRSFAACLALAGAAATVVACGALLL